ncbi:hypothetical protein EYC84_011364 [Monilinia fructicola]|uniref:Uncharacterized protein n=1 Tax=Monilinia fructicola TaxID=38448 RepID=A0A5M9J6P3_MONFR|nr:hypothetical protein EYC84_011364 [Monilinia fructicola]
MYRLHVSERSSLHNLCLRSCNRKQFSKEIDSSSSLLTCLIHDILHQLKDELLLLNHLFERCGASMFLSTIFPRHFDCIMFGDKVIDFS